MTHRCSDCGSDNCCCSATKTPKPPEDDRKRKVQVSSKNLYDEHPLMIHSGLFWRCDHGSTGWYACVPCGNRHPERFVRHVQELKAFQSEKIEDRFIFE